MFEQAFRNIDDVLRKEAGCTTELDYTEQSSWLLFLKCLDGLEADKAAEDALDGKNTPASSKSRTAGTRRPRPRARMASWTTTGRWSAMTSRSSSTNSSSPTSTASRPAPPGRTPSNTIDAEKSDLFDVLAYVRYNTPTVTREARAGQARVYINSHFNAKQQAFLDFVLQHYVTVGVEELDQQKLKPLFRLKYHDSIADAVADLGEPEEIGQTFAGFQKSLYQTVG
jgi:hypothetical protein